MFAVSHECDHATVFGCRISTSVGHLSLRPSQNLVSYLLFQFNITEVVKLNDDKLNLNENLNLGIFGYIYSMV